MPSIAWWQRHGAILRIRAKDPLIADQGRSTRYRKADISERQKPCWTLPSDNASIVGQRAASGGGKADIGTHALKAHDFDEDIWDIAAISAFWHVNRLANVTSMRPNAEFTHWAASRRSHNPHGVVAWSRRPLLTSVCAPRQWLT